MPEVVAISIGNFDGVHLGHRQLIRRARQAVGSGGTVVAVTFEPHPVAVLRPELAPRRLITPAQRVARLREAGADQVDVIGIDRSVLDLDERAFLALVVERHAPRAIVEGPDFRFGAGRSGSVATLRAEEAAHGYETIVVDPVEAPLANQQLVRVSSSFIRLLLAAGRVDDARRLLGHPYVLGGRVIQGDRRGRTIGVPTANLGPGLGPGLGHGLQMLPADGVYSAEATSPDGAWHRAAVCIGVKPTFGASNRQCEVHLIDAVIPLDAYDWSIEVRFHRFLRGNIGFASVDELRAQLARDIDRARTEPVPAATPLKVLTA